jgi:polyisoprenoid-binding protein YceI
MKTILRVLALVGLAAPAVANAQTTLYKLDEDRSLVWWQIDPHFSHLWASSCPSDPSWQPGEGHSAGYYISYATRPHMKQTHEHETRIPLFPRKTVRPNCRHATKGQFTTNADFSNFKGYVLVSPDSIETGADHRNAFTHKYVYSTAKYPNIRFAIDSLSNVQMDGDSITATAVGVFEFRGVTTPLRIPVDGLKADNTIRVRGKFAMPAQQLHEKYGVSSTALGAGIGLKLWDTLYMGVDLILTPAT